MRSTIKTLFLSLAAVAFFSCAETTPEDYSTLEQLSLDEWVKKNRSGATKFNEGMYITTLEEAPEGAEEIKDGSWVMLNYTGYDLQGDVYANRYENIARQVLSQDVFHLKTHYAPQLVRVVTSGGNVSQGQYEALKTMKIGQKVELIMPSDMAYSTYGTDGLFLYGYQGNASIGASKPAIIEMVATLSVTDIMAYENKQVQDYAIANFAGVESAADSIAENFYIEINYDNADMSDTIRLDSTFQFYYTGKFLDGFIFDTNHADIALDIWNIKLSGTPLIYTQYGDIVEAFHTLAATDTLRNGCTFKMVFPSLYGYGEEGSSPTSTSAEATVIQAYSPLIFEVEILAKVEAEEEEE